MTGPAAISWDGLRRYLPDRSSYADVRLIELADGVERGIRVLQFRTGGGLEFEVLVDRSMDIGRLSMNARTLSWHSPTGFRAPWLQNAWSDRGQGFLRAHSGLLATCGLDHIRQPETDRADGNPLHPAGEIDYPLHGEGAFQPARLIGYGCASVAGVPTLWCEGESRQAMVFGACLSLTRRIEVAVGGTAIRLRDTVRNIGPLRATHMLLYHLNFGYPLLDEGAEIWSHRGDTVWASPGAAAANPRRFGPPSDEYRAQLLVHRFAPPADGRAVAALVNPRAQLGVAAGVDAEALPYFQQLTIEGAGLYCVALEPCTTGARTRALARQCGEMRFLEPDESREYAVDLEILSGPSELHALQRRMEPPGKLQTQDS